MRVLGTRAFGVSVRVRPGAMKKKILTTVRLPDSGEAVLSFAYFHEFNGRSCLYLLRLLTVDRWQAVHRWLCWHSLTRRRFLLAV